MEDYFSDILRFHSCVLAVLSRPSLFHPCPLKYKLLTISRLENILQGGMGKLPTSGRADHQSAQARQEKLSHERLQAHAIHQGVQDFRGHADGRFDRLEADLDRIRNALASECLKRQTSAEDQDMKAYLKDKLNISRFGSRSRLNSPELSSPSAGDWIFQHPHFQAWERAASSQGNVLFLNGSPGAGISSHVSYVSCFPLNKVFKAKQLWR